MEATMKPLNIHDDWDDIVNAHSRQIKADAATFLRSSRARRGLRLALIALAFAAAAVLIFFFAPVLNPLAIVFACAGSFMLGIFTEFRAKRHRK